MTRVITFPYRYCPVVGFGCWYLVADGCTVCRFCHREIPAADLRAALPTVS